MQPWGRLTDTDDRRNLLIESRLIGRLFQQGRNPPRRSTVRPPTRRHPNDRRRSCSREELAEPDLRLTDLLDAYHPYAAVRRFACRSRLVHAILGCTRTPINPFPDREASRFGNPTLKTRRRRRGVFGGSTVQAMISSLS